MKFDWGSVFSKVGLIGMGAGLLNGLLGIGGGILIVPGLILWKQVPHVKAAATSLGTVFLVALVALVLHLGLSGYHLNPVGMPLLIIAGMVGGWVGANLLRNISERVMILLLAGMTFFSALHLASISLGFSQPLSLEPPPLWSYGVVGFGSGIVSGMLGLGGGGLTVLGFSIGYHLPVLEVLPLALTINVTNALAGILSHRGKSNIQWDYVMTMFPLSLIGIFLGGVGATWLPPDVLRILFAGFFLVMGARLFLSGLRKKTAPKSN